MAQLRRKIQFDEYKTIKDEIIAVSEQRYENILTKRLTEFKKELMGEVDKRFETMKEEVDKRFHVVYWIFGIFITLYLATYSILLNLVLNLRK